MDRDLPEESLVYVKLKTGQEIKVKEPRIDDGVLTGLTPLSDTLPGLETEIRINVYEIKSISVERIEHKKSIIVLATIVGSIVIVFYLVGRAYCCWGES